MPRLLQALLPRGAQLTSLAIENWGTYGSVQGPALPLWPGVVTGCSQLAALEELKLSCEAFGGDADAGVAVLLQQATRLRGLALWVAGEADSAPCLASLPASVTALSIGTASLPGIPHNRLAGERRSAAAAAALNVGLLCHAVGLTLQRVPFPSCRPEQLARSAHR